MRNGRITILALLAVAVTVGALWLTNGAVTPKEATWDDVLAEAKKGGYRLISTEDLWKHYSENRESLLLVDTRQEWEYRTGHIQGAVNFPMEPTWRNGGKKGTWDDSWPQTKIAPSSFTERA